VLVRLLYRSLQEAYNNAALSHGFEKVDSIRSTLTFHVPNDFKLGQGH
jgi:hypothetical protein